MRRVIAGVVAPLLVLMVVLGACGTQPNDLTVGKCVDQLPAAGSTVGSVTTIDCAKTHAAEVYAVFNWSGSESNDQFPGDDAVTTQAETGCKDAFQPYVGTAFDQSTLEATYMLPTSDTWKDGDRTFICLVMGPSGGTLDSSVKGSNK